jgi:hypothetical protein
MIPLPPKDIRSISQQIVSNDGWELAVCCISLDSFTGSDRAAFRLVWSAKRLPPVAIMGAAMIVGAIIENRVTGRRILVQCASMIVGMPLIGGGLLVPRPP